MSVFKKGDTEIVDVNLEMIGENVENEKTLRKLEENTCTYRAIDLVDVRCGKNKKTNRKVEVLLSI